MSPIGALDTEYGARIHHDGDRFPDHVLGDAGLDQAWTKAIGEIVWRDAVTRSMDEALEVVGRDIGVPTMVFPNGLGYFGPVLSPAPTGNEALALFDHLVALSETPGFFELERGRRLDPRFGVRP